MDIKGRITHILPLQTGEGKNGTWKKQDFVIETDGQYPKKVCFSIWGDKYNESFLAVGNELNVSFDPESREYNGRWYTELRAWKIELAGSKPESNDFASPSAPAVASPQAMSPSFTKSTEEDDDLPF